MKLRLQTFLESLTDKILSKVGSVEFMLNDIDYRWEVAAKLNGKTIGDIGVIKNDDEGIMILRERGWILIEVANIDKKYQKKGMYRYMLGVMSNEMDKKIFGYKGLFSDAFVNDLDRSDDANGFWNKMEKDGLANKVEVEGGVAYKLSKQNAKKLLKMPNKIKAIS